MRYFVKLILLTVFLFISFRSGLRTPIEFITKYLEDILTIGLVLFMFFRIAFDISKKQPISRFELMLTGMMIIPFWSAFIAYIRFEQPLFYGLVAARNFYLYLGGALIYYLLIKKIIGITDLKKAFLASAWITLILFLIVYFTLDPAKYLDTPYIGYNELKGGYIFRFVIPLIVYAFLYYIIVFFNSGKSKFLFLLCAIPFFYMIVFVRQDRSIILILLFVLLLYFFRKVFFRSALFYTGLTIIIASLTLLFVNILEFKIPEETREKYINLWLTVTGKETEESSTNVRRVQVIKVWPDIEKHIFFGNGELYPKWKNGFARIYGYFYPTDIGLLGILYIFGLLGTLLIFIQYIYAARIVKSLKDDPYDNFKNACIYFLLFVFLDSFTSGQTLFFPANSTLMIAILTYYAFQQNQKPFTKPCMMFPSA